MFRIFEERVSVLCAGSGCYSTITALVIRDRERHFRLITGVCLCFVFMFFFVGRELSGEFSKQMRLLFKTRFCIQFVWIDF